MDSIAARTFRSSLMSNNEFEDDESLYPGKTCLEARPGSICFRLSELDVSHMPVEGTVD
jgi:hypothetical protein